MRDFALVTTASSRIHLTPLRVLNKNRGELRMTCDNLSLKRSKPPPDSLRAVGRQASGLRIEFSNQCLHHLFRIVMASVT